MEKKTCRQNILTQVRLYAFPLLVAAVGMIVSALVFTSMQKSEQQLARLEFEQESDTRYFTLKRDLEQAQFLVSSFQAFVSHADFTRQEFDIYCKTLVSHYSAIRALNFAPRVSAAERDAFEQREQRHGLPAFRITELSADGKMIPASRRPEYFPISWLYPHEGREPALGFDLASEPKRRQAMEMAGETGKQAATALLQLVAPEGSHPSFMIFAPVFYKESLVDSRQGHKNVRGYATGVFYLDTILENSRTGLPLVGIDTYLYDGPLRDRESLMYYHPSRITKMQAASSTPPATDHDGGFVISKPLNVGGRQWQVVYRATPQFISSQSTLHPLGALGTGLLFSVVLASYLGTLIQRKKSVESLVAIRTGELELARASLETKVEERTEELRKNRNMLVSIMDSVPQTIFWKDRDSVYLGCNRIFARQAGKKSPEEVVGKTDFDLPWLREESESYRADDREVMESNKAKLHIVETQQQLDGTSIWLDTTKIPLVDDAGHVYGILGVYEDISERKRTEESLKESEARLRFALEGSNDGLWDVQLQTGSVYMSPRGCEILGYTPDELGKVVASWSDLVHPDDLPPTHERLQAHLEGRIPVFEIEQRLLTKSGNWKWVLTRGKLVSKLADGTPLRMTGTHTDISESKQLEEQLRQSQKMEAVGQLAGGVAHDFNNILSVIMGYSGMLQMDVNLNASQKEKIDHIINAAEKAAQLTGGLLAFSRKQALTQKNVNLNDVVQHLQKFLTRVIGEDVRLKTIVHEVDLPVCVDSGQIEQTLINLATNARDAMPQGGLLTIETALQEIGESFTHFHGYGKAGRYAVITVSDTGMGMDEETRNKIFEPFFTTKETGKGTGLGLAIVYGIIKQHNGFINLYSEPGKGSAFRIYLPLLSKGTLPATEPVAPPELKGGNETILVAEDEPEVRKLVAGMLAEYGYEVILAEDGEDVVRQFAVNRNRVRLILLDMIMPKQSGKAAAEEIRNLQPDVKILFSSGYTADFIRNRGVEEEGMELLMKPYQPLELLRKVREMLDR